MTADGRWLNSHIEFFCGFADLFPSRVFYGDPIFFAFTTRAMGAFTRYEYFVESRCGFCRFDVVDESSDFGFKIGDGLECIDANGLYK